MDIKIHRYHKNRRTGLLKSRIPNPLKKNSFRSCRTKSVVHKWRLPTAYQSSLQDRHQWVEAQIASAGKQGLGCRQDHRSQDDTWKTETEENDKGNGILARENIPDDEKWWLHFCFLGNFYQFDTLHMNIDLQSLSNVQRQNWLQYAIAPRPIALVSTPSVFGERESEPLLLFQPVFIQPTSDRFFGGHRGGRDNSTKHTLDNVLRLRKRSWTLWDFRTSYSRFPLQLRIP